MERPLTNPTDSIINAYNQEGTNILKEFAKENPEIISIVTAFI